MTHGFYAFDDFRLDLTRGALFQGQKELKLRPKSFEVLKYIAENQGRLVSKNEIIDTVWQGTAVTDDSLVQCMKDIRRAFGDVGQKLIKTVPCRGYIFDTEILRIGPRVYVERTEELQLIYEESDEIIQEVGLTSTPRIPLVHRFSRRKLRTATAFAVLVIATVTVALLYRPIMSWWIKPPSIAVLPTFNATGDAEQDYISDGLTESIITSLKRLKPSRLRVSAQSTIFLFKNKELDPRSVGGQLGVDSVLASRMFLQNNLRTFKFELINVADGSVLWSNQYSASWGNTFGSGSNANEEIVAMQNAIPNDVAAQLPLGLNDADREILTRRYTQNPEAYDLYLKGRAEFREVTPSSLRKSIEYFERAIDLDPQFATAFWAMGMSYRVQGLIDERPDKEANEKAAYLFKNALKIDNTLSLAVEALKFSDLDARDWKAIEKAGEKHPGYGAYLIASGRIDEQLENEKRLLSFEPYMPTLNLDHCWTLFIARRYDETIAQCRKTLNISVDGKPNFGPKSPWIHLHLGNAYCQKGMFTEAIAEMKSAIELAEDSEAMWAALGYTYAKAGQRDEAINILNFLNERISRGEYVPALNVAWIYAELGDNDQAFTWLDKAVDEGEGRLLNMPFETELDGLRSDPRFPELIQRIGLPN